MFKIWKKTCKFRHFVSCYSFPFWKFSFMWLVLTHFSCGITENKDLYHNIDGCDHCLCGDGPHLHVRGHCHRALRLYECDPASDRLVSWGHCRQALLSQIWIHFFTLIEIFDHNVWGKSFGEILTHFPENIEIQILRQFAN